MTGPPFTFAAVARPLAQQGWRPFPGRQGCKTPAMRGWHGLNGAEWDDAALVAAIGDYQPDDLFCCCLAAQPEIVAIDLDIVGHENAAFADKLANNILGRTPLVRIGFAPKQIRVYRNAGGIHSRKLHPLEIFAGTGQFIAFGWHEKAGRPYLWPNASPLTISADSDAIPLVTPSQLDHFSTELFKAYLYERAMLVHCGQVIFGSEPNDPLSTCVELGIRYDDQPVETLGGRVRERCCKIRNSLGHNGSSRRCSAAKRRSSQ